jgi:PKD repeat protein
LSPLSVNFTNESSGTIASWQWDFGDGSLSDQQNPTHIYNFPGTYAVSLTAIGPLGSSTETKANYITVYGPEPPVAAFSAFPLSGVTPLSVNFTDGSTGTIDTWSWDFGDGYVSNQRNPTHVYEVQGTYSVSLTVTGGSVSDTGTMIDYITVVSPDAPDLNGRLKAFHLYEFGVSIGLTIRIENTGNQKADRFKLAFYLSNDGITLGELLRERDLLGLRAGYVKDVTFKYGSPDALSGRYIIVLFDSSDQVLETDETNNKIIIRIP